MGRLSNYFQGSRSLALDFGDQGDQESSDFSILLLCSGTVCLQKKQRLKDNFHGGSIYDIYVTTGLPLCPLSPLSHAMHYGKDKSHGKGILAILKMAAEIGINELSEVNEPAREPTTIVPVTAAIYHNGQEKPTERWSFELGLILSEDKLLSSMLKRLEKGYGVKDKASALGILKFKIQLSVKDFTPKLPEWPKGRVFAIDCQEQWDNCLPKVLGLQRELIGG